jgi:LPXTG-motif cell wall-anchored protein
MKKFVLVISMAIILVVSGLSVAVAQEQPKPKKDTVNMDTNAKPQVYYPVEDDKSKGLSGATIGIIVGAVIVVGAAGFFLLKKKK